NTDKAIVEVPAPASGVLRETLKQPNDPIHAGDVLGRIEVVAAEAAPGMQPAPPPTAPANAGPAPARTQDLSPAVRQLVKQHHLDVTKITGTGKGGRITHEDVQNYLKRQTAAPGETAPASRRVPHSPTRRRIAQHMVESLLRTAPHV